MNQTNHSSAEPSTQDFLFPAEDAAASAQGETEDFLPADRAAQQQEFSLPEKLFSAEQQAEEQEDGSQTRSAEKLFAKYCGNDIALPKREMQVLAQALNMPVEECIKTIQKGMNYERLQRRLGGRDAAKTSAQNTDSAENSEGALRSSAEDPLVPEKQKLHISGSSRESLKASWQEALAAYPELDPDKFAPQLRVRLAQGEDPMKLLQQQEIAELKEKLVKQEQKMRSSRRAPGSVRSSAAENRDDFLTGFLSVR